jgi:hypothetical protein
MQNLEGIRSLSSLFSTYDGTRYVFVQGEAL